MDSQTIWLSIVGARPQFIKLAPLARAIAAHNQSGKAPIRHLILHTGQHYDPGLSDVFFDELEIPKADHHLGVGSGSHGKQTAKMLENIEATLIAEKPSVVIIYGDTNSTIAGSLAAAKLHIPVAHIEAGLRSFNRKMPEEINRVMADHASDLLLAPTHVAVGHLTREGLGDRTVLTGDIMYDAVLQNVILAQEKATIGDKLGLKAETYALATCHRAENTDDPQRLMSILNTLNEIAANRFPVVLPLHPRTANQLKTHHPDWTPHSNLQLIDPVGYLDMMHLVAHARMILTDSGGLQKEAFFLNRPCITMRDETEWTETVTEGGNVIVGADSDKIREAVAAWESRISSGTADFSSAVQKAFGKGDAAEIILNSIASRLG
ncbi:UNVERIFIED_CONTAM: hypothetical protein GTU68_011316 [Idotea baltica]|nr:hypothetical protein [Idotea baltica]